MESPLILSIKKKEKNNEVSLQGNKSKFQKKFLLISKFETLFSVQIIEVLSGFLLVNSSSAVTPKFTVEPDNPTYADEGLPIVIDCAAEGDPKPTIQWDKDSVMNDFDDKRWVAVISAKNHKRQSVTAKRENSQTPKVLTAILTLPNLT